MSMDGTTEPTSDIPQNLPTPIETGADISDPSAHAFIQRQRAERDEANAKRGKQRSIRDSLKDAEKAVNERTRNETIKKALGKDLGDLRPSERKNLAEYLREKSPNISEDEREARKAVLSELRKLEPKREKAETAPQGEDRRREAVERAFKAHAGDLNRADLSTTEQRQIRADLKTRWPEKKLSDVLRYFEAWHEKIAADPQNAWQALAQEYASYTSPQNDRQRKSAGEGKSIGDSLKRASSDLSDVSDMAEWIEKYGAQTPELIRRANEWDKALRADPFGAAARLAANMGALKPNSAPAVPQQQITAPRSQEEYIANVERGVDLYVQHYAPDLYEHADNIVQILNSGVIPGHLDNVTRLRLAYEAAKEHAEEFAARGRKSISGGALSSKGSSHAPSKSIRGALERAMARG